MLARMKKGLVLFMTICVVLSMMPMLSFSVFAATAGDGTASNPYQITTADELKTISGNAHYILMNDIVLSESWTPIAAFNGTLDGNGKTISGLNVSSTNARNGFIQTLDYGGTVKNLTVYGSVTCLNTGNCGGQGTGGIAGYNSGKILGCEFHGTVSQRQGDNMCVAGIAGYNAGIITDCKNYGDITGISTGGGYNAVYVGGIVGSNHGSVAISDCVNYGIISGAVPNTATNVGEIWGSSAWQSHGAYVGGIAGDTNESDAPGCSNEGIVVGQNTNAEPVNLTGITNPKDITLSAPVSNNELLTRLPSSVVLATTGGNRVGTVTWDISGYDASKENAAYIFNGEVTLPSKVTNDNGIPLEATIALTVGGGTVTPPPEPVDYALYFAEGKLYKATVGTGGAITKGEEYTLQTDKWSVAGNILTLKGLRFETTASRALIMSDGTILLLQEDTESTLTSTGILGGGIYGEGGFTIDGDGTLKAIGTYGIVTSDLVIESGTVYATGTGEGSYGLYGAAGSGEHSGIIRGGKVIASGEVYGIFGAGDDLHIEGGEIWATGGNTTYGAICIYNGTLTNSDNVVLSIKGSTLYNAATLQAAEIYRQGSTCCVRTEGSVCKTVQIKAAPVHKHCVCGGSAAVGDHKTHSDVDYQPLDSSFTGGTLPTGNYCLTEDIILNQYIKIEDRVNLCLNGHTIDAGADYGILVNSNKAVFNLADCTGKGLIQSGCSYAFENCGGTTNIYDVDMQLTNPYYGALLRSGEMNLYGGSIISDGTAVAAMDGVLNISGGVIKAGRSGVLDSGSGTVIINITGGTIESANSTYSNVELDKNATLHLGGAPALSTVQFETANQISAKCGGQDYIGGAIQLKKVGTFASGDIGNIIVSDVTKGVNDTKFSLADKGYYLKHEGTNLILARVTHSVTLTEGTGYVLEAASGNTSPVDYGSSFTFNFALAAGYSKTDAFAVKVNGTAVILPESGSYTISNITKDTTVTVEGVADTTAPNGEITVGTNKWHEFLNTITFGLFFKDTQSVQIAATDLGSGVYTISYYIADGAMTEEELKAFDGWVEYKGSFNIEPNNKYVIYAKLVDKDDNTAYINTNGLVLDNIDPALTQNGTAVSNNAKYYGDTEFTVSDLYPATVTVDGSAVTPDANGKFTITADSLEHTIVVTDQAGNSITRNVEVHQCFTVTYKTNEDFVLGTLTYGVTESNMLPTASQLRDLFPEAVAKLTETGSLYVKNTLWYSDKDFKTQAVMPEAPAAGQSYVFYCAFTTNTEITSAETQDHTYGGDLINGYNFSAYYGVSWATGRYSSEFEFVYEKKVGDEWQIVGDDFKTDVNGDTWDNRIYPKTVADSGIYRIAYIKVSVKDKAENLLFSEYIYPTGADREGKQVNVLPRTLTISSVTAVDRDYDGTSGVTLTGGTLQGLLPNDDVSFTLGSGRMADGSVGSAKAVTTNVTLTGEDACNYVLTQPTRITVNITAASQSAPDGIGKTDETIDGKADSSITGVNNTMEYRKDGETDYTPITGATLENLEDGTYYVRYAAKENYNASPDVTVTIIAGKMLNVTFKADGVTLGTKQVSWNGSIDALPNIPAKPGYDQTTPTWDKTLADLTGIQADITATAQYTINRYTVPLTSGEGYMLEAVSANPVNHGESFTFKVVLSEGYSKTDEFAVQYNGSAATLNADGSYTVTVLTDLTYPVVSGVADITAPDGEITVGTNKWHEFLNGITFGLFFKDTQSVEITATDLGSGVKGIAYYIAEAEMTPEEVKSISDWQEYTDSFDIEPNHEYIIYVKLTDNSGNVSYINSDGIVMDNIPPVISGIEDGKTYCEAVEITVDEAYVDTVTVNGKAVTLTDGKFVVAAAAGEQTIAVTDKAGNRTEITCTVNDGHTWGEYTSNGDATYTADGTKTAKCRFCDATDTASDEGSMLTDTPKTGDSSNVWLWITLLFVFGVGSTEIIVIGKKKKTYR